MIVRRVDLHCQRGNSDKVYRLEIAEDNGSYMVYFANARRGAALKMEPKTPRPVSLSEAETVVAKVVKEKTSAAKGYVITDDFRLSGFVTTDTANTPRDVFALAPAQRDNSGIGVQLLNPIEEAEARALCRDPAWVAQEKHDGERRVIRVMSGRVDGINRNGEFVTLKSEIAGGVDTRIGMVVDAEDMGTYLAVFDLIEYAQTPYAQKGFLERYAMLSSIVGNHAAFRLSPVARTTDEKIALLDRMIAENREGVVFKRADAPYTAGRPNSGGDQRKFKLYTEASVVVSKVNAKRSVQMSVVDDAGRSVVVGNVTIPVNAPIPGEGDVIEVRYLYAYKSGSLYQPTFNKARPDQKADDCRQSQLKYKPDAVAA